MYVARQTDVKLRRTRRADAYIRQYLMPTLGDVSVLEVGERERESQTGGMSWHGLQAQAHEHSRAEQSTVTRRRLFVCFRRLNHWLNLAGTSSARLGSARLGSVRQDGA